MSVASTIGGIIVGIVGVVVLFFFGYLIINGCRQMFGRRWKLLSLNMKKKKLLENDTSVGLCIKAVEMDFDVLTFRKHLMLENKYKQKDIDELVYLFNIVNKEMKGGDSDGKRISGRKDKKD